VVNVYRLFFYTQKSQNKGT